MCICLRLYINIQDELAGFQEKLDELTLRVIPELEAIQAEHKSEYAHMIAEIEAMKAEMSEVCVCVVW